MKKKRYQPSKQKVLAGNPVWKAFAKKPMTATQQDDIALSSYSALDELMAGRGQRSHTNDLASACNIALLLSEFGYGEELIPLIQSAQNVVVACRERASETHQYTLNESDVEAIRVLLDIQGQQNLIASAADIVKAIELEHDRLRAGEVLTATARPSIGSSGHRLANVPATKGL